MLLITVLRAVSSYNDVNSKPQKVAYLGAGMEIANASCGGR